MTSNGCPFVSGLVFHPEQSINRVSKEYQHVLPCPEPNQDVVKSRSLNLNLHQKVEWNPANGWLCSNQFVTNSTDRRQLIDGQERTPHTLLFSIGIAEQCIRREKIMKLLASGSAEAERSLLELSMLFDLWGPQPPIANLPQHAPDPHSRRCFSDNEPPQSLIYPTQEFYFQKRQVDLVGDMVPDGQLLFNSNGVEMSDVLSIIAEFYLSKNSIKSSKQAMLVPFFERRKRASANTNKSRLGTAEVAPLKSPEKVKDKTAQKKTSRKATKGRDLYSNSYLHASESLLSIMFDTKQQGRNVILSLKKCGPELPCLLTQISASIAGTGIAVLFSVVWKVACGQVPFSASKAVNTGLGLALVWLSWAVNKLRDTVVSISKNSGKLAAKEDEVVDNLDRTLKEVYFHAAALLAVAVLNLA